MGHLHVITNTIGDYTKYNFKGGLNNIGIGFDMNAKVIVADFWLDVIRFYVLTVTRVVFLLLLHNWGGEDFLKWEDIEQLLPITIHLVYSFCSYSLSTWQNCPFLSHASNINLFMWCVHNRFITIYGSNAIWSLSSDCILLTIE